MSLPEDGEHPAAGGRPGGRGRRGTFNRKAGHQASCTKDRRTIGGAWQIAIGPQDEIRECRAEGAYLGARTDSEPKPPSLPSCFL